MIYMIYLIYKINHTNWGAGCQVDCKIRHALLEGICLFCSRAVKLTYPELSRKREMDLGGTIPILRAELLRLIRIDTRNPVSASGRLFLYMV